MGKYTDFFLRIQEAVDAFNLIPSTEPVKVVSHYDSDGICACAILVRALQRKGMAYSVSVYQSLSKDILKELSREETKHFFFADLGSGVMSGIEEHLEGRDVFVLDHHPVDREPRQDGIHHVNPHTFGIDGSKEIAGAGVAFLFAVGIDGINTDLAHLAIIGALGDIQEDEEGFLRLNREILDTAIAQGKLEVKSELRVFGRETKPLVKILEHMQKPLIPGVSGIDGAGQTFLKEVKVPATKSGKWRLMTDLTKDEEDRIAKGIIKRRLDENLLGDIFGSSYILSGEKKGTPLRDAREFSTLLNACGRLNSSSIGIGACLGSDRMKKRAMEQLQAYRQQMGAIMRWFHENRKSFIEGDGYAIINAEENIPPELAGTLCSIIIHSNVYPQGTYVMALARNTVKDETKVSLRAAGKVAGGLNIMLQTAVDAVGGESGGHLSAAGAIIPTAKEEAFVERAIRVLEKQRLMEDVV